MWHDSFICVTWLTHLQPASTRALARSLPCLCIQRDSRTQTHTATHCDTLQHTETHCNTLQHTATHRCALLWIGDSGIHWRHRLHAHLQFQLGLRGIQCYGVASISRLLKIISLFCKRTLSKRQYSAKKTYNFKETTNRSHPIACCCCSAMQSVAVYCSVLQCITACCSVLQYAAMCVKKRALELIGSITFTLTYT